MAKLLGEIIYSQEPKVMEKINKALEKDPTSQMFFAAFRQEAMNPTTRDYQKLRICITDSYICYYNLGIGMYFKIIPITSIKNLYRSCMVNGEYTYEHLNLAIETSDNVTHYFANVLRNGTKNFDIYNDVIADVKARIAAWQGGAQV